MAIDYPIDSGSKDLNSRVLGVWAPKPCYLGPWSHRDMDSGKGAFIFGQPPLSAFCATRGGVMPTQGRHDKYRSRLDSKCAGGGTTWDMTIPAKRTGMYCNLPDLIYLMPGAW